MPNFHSTVTVGHFRHFLSIHRQRHSVIVRYRLDWLSSARSRTSQHCAVKNTVAMSLSALSRKLSQIAIRPTTTNHVTPRFKATTSTRALQMIQHKTPSSSPLGIRWQSSSQEGNDETAKDAISSLAVSILQNIFVQSIV